MQPQGCHCFHCFHASREEQRAGHLGEGEEPVSSLHGAVTCWHCLSSTEKKEAAEKTNAKKEETKGKLAEGAASQPDSQQKMDHPAGLSSPRIGVCSGINVCLA